MSIIDATGDFFAGDADEAAEDAARYGVQAANQSSQIANDVRFRTLRAERDSTERANQGLNEAQAQALRFRQQAGETLTAAEQQALAQYDAAEGRATDALYSGQDLGIAALDEGEAGALGFIDQGRTGGVNALMRGIGALDEGEAASLGYIDDATGRAVGTLEPYAQAGADAQTEAANLMGLNGPEAQEAARARFQVDPGYQFMVEQGTKALEANLNASQGRYSGATLKALTEYGQGLGQQEYGNYFNRLTALGDDGQAASSQIAGIEQTAGANRADIASSAAANRSNVYQAEADLVADMAGQEAGIAERTGVNRSGVYTDTAGQVADAAEFFGGRSGDTVFDAGRSRADILTGSGDLVMENQGQVANNLIQSGDDITDIYNAFYANQTNNLTNKANSKAAGRVGGANARAQGVNNALSLAGGAFSYFA
ncbi:MAG: hypothetical protein AAGF48_12910 [Pseudomonadota bacterium]